MKSLPFLTLLLIMITSTLVASGKERRKSDPGPHPIKVLKCVRENNNAAFNQAKGTMQVWLQNTADADVDKVKMEVELWTRDGRYVDKVVKDIGVIKASSKSYQTVKWDLPGESYVQQKIWILYNRGKEKLTQYEAEPPVW